MNDIIIIFTTHLDVGFTDSAENIINYYCDTYIPWAIENAYELFPESEHIHAFPLCRLVFVVGFPMPCIEPIIAGHLEMPFRDMLDKEGNKVHDRESFFHMGIILVFIVVESHVTAIVRINTGGGNNRPAKVTADVFYDSVRIAEIWFGIDIEPIFTFFVNGGFGLAEGMEDADETGHKVSAFVLEMSE